ncbi:MAG: hypothetical protein IJ792_04350 [Oscillospiraceae bacterium]|nr:hypothetical protein [Oscillospiraceae bacterium]
MVKRSTLSVVGLFALLLGLLAGVFISQMLPPRLQSTLAESVNVTDSTSSDDSVDLLRTALDTARAFRDGDYATLAYYVHPAEGVTFTPNTTVDRSADQTFTVEQIANAANTSETYIWGTATDSAVPISLTFADYRSAYVWDEDYLAQARISVDSTRVAGNALENLTDAYPDCRYVEFYCPGEDPQTDWSALRLVYRQQDGVWYLVGVVHSAWGA